MAAPRPILLDTDIGSDVDDALALGVVLASSEAVELIAVTTVGRGGVVRARVAASLLALAGRAQVEVCVGETRPILRPREQFNWFGHEERCIAAGAAGAISTEPGPERIVRAAREVPALEIVLIGPLTNLARALALDPGLPRRVERITIMGGHVRGARIGDFVAAPGIDYNLCSDPEASVAVLGAGFRTTLVTADVTLATWLREGDLGDLEAAGPLALELARQVRIWAPVQREIFTELGGSVAPDNVAYLHDPLAALSLIDDSSLRLEGLRIVTSVEDGVLRTREADPGSGFGVPMRVATAVQASAAERAIVKCLSTL